jgi:hypothetical protein
MHVEVIKSDALGADKRAYVGRVGRVVERYLFPDRSRIMFAGGHEVILPDAALRKVKAPRNSTKAAA